MAWLLALALLLPLRPGLATACGEDEACAARALAADLQEPSGLGLVQLAARQPGPALELLEANATTVANATANTTANASANATVNATAKAVANATLETELARLRSMVEALEASVKKNGGKRSNYTRSASCSKFPGGGCFFTACPEASGALCGAASICECPDYTCAVNGRCELSASEVVSAVNGGVSNVAGKVTDVCRNVQGVAESVGMMPPAISGLSDTIGGILGSLTGADEGDCSSRYITTCMFSDCPAELGYTASCQYGSCQCKEGFCSMKTPSTGQRSCMVDIQRVVSSAVSTFQR